jgi:hypothetical protein
MSDNNLQQDVEALLEYLLDAETGVDRAAAADWIAVQEEETIAICLLMLADKLSPIFNERAPIAGVN